MTKKSKELTWPVILFPFLGLCLLAGFLAFLCFLIYDQGYVDGYREAYKVGISDAVCLQRMGHYDRDELKTCSDDVLAQLKEMGVK